MKSNHSVSHWLKDAFMGCASILTALMMAAVVERLLVPDACLYHGAEYLGGKEIPWWIDTFFPLDEARHPESGPLYGTLWLGAAVGFFFVLRFSAEYLAKRVSRKEIKE